MCSICMCGMCIYMSLACGCMHVCCVHSCLCAHLLWHVCCACPQCVCVHVYIQVCLYVCMARYMHTHCVPVECVHIVCMCLCAICIYDMCMHCDCMYMCVCLCVYVLVSCEARNNVSLGICSGNWLCLPGLCSVLTLSETESLLPEFS